MRLGAFRVWQLGGFGRCGLELSAMAAGAAGRGEGVDFIRLIAGLVGFESCGSRLCTMMVWGRSVLWLGTLNDGGLETSGKNFSHEQL